jgi:hypothetical protein
VANVAVPPLRGTVASVVPPSAKLTLPVGRPAPGATACTVAVKITWLPNAACVAEVMSEVELLDWFTVCVKGVDVLLALKLASPV